MFELPSLAAPTSRLIDTVFLILSWSILSHSGPTLTAWCVYVRPGRNSVHSSEAT